MAWTTCNICGVKFKRKLSHIGKFNFCCRKCADVHHSKVLTGKKKSGKHLICPVCKKEFYRKMYAVNRAKRNFCSKDCANIAHSRFIKENKIIGYRFGKENPMWNGGVSFEPYAPEFNKKLRHKIIIRDDSKCALCGKENKLHVHHIDFDKKNCEIKNLITLCVSCHGTMKGKNRNSMMNLCKEIVNELD